MVDQYIIDEASRHETLKHKTKKLAFPFLCCFCVFFFFFFSYFSSAFPLAGDAALREKGRVIQGFEMQFEGIMNLNSV